MSNVAVIRPYAKQAFVQFGLVDAAGALVKGHTFTAGDVKIRAVTGAETNTTNLPTAIGNSYDLSLTQAEMTQDQIILTIEDISASSTYLPFQMHINTDGMRGATYFVEGLNFGTGYVATVLAPNQFTTTDYAFVGSFNLDGFYLGNNDATIVFKFNNSIDGILGYRSARIINVTGPTTGGSATVTLDRSFNELLAGTEFFVIPSVFGKFQPLSSEVDYIRKIIENKYQRDIATGVYTHFDDDGTTPIKTGVAEDDGTTVKRVPA